MDSCSDLIVVVRRVYDRIPVDLLFQFKIRAGSFIRTEMEYGPSEVFFPMELYGFLEFLV